jgi:hypothetical protein
VNIFAKRTTRRHKSNHLALEMKTFFSTLHKRWTLARIPTLKPGHPTDYHQWQRREREGGGNLHITLKQQAQSLSDYARQDLSDATRRPRILDM